jgi:hypothetical protein
MNAHKIVLFSVVILLITVLFADAFYANNGTLK